MLLKTETKKNDEKDYFAFYGAYYGAVADGLLDKSIPQRINTRRKQFADKREHPYAE